MAVRQIAILIGQEAAQIAERIRCLQRMAAYNRSLIGGEMNLTTADKMVVAERCIEDVVHSVRELLHAQVVAIRDPRDAVDMMTHLRAMAAEEDTPPQPWPVAGS